MRTTLTLEPDVSARVAQQLAQGSRTLKELINTALRLGLDRLDGSTAREAKPRFETPTYSTGRCALPNLDDISEVLASVEGEDFR
jgi:hypothetical protein